MSPTEMKTWEVCILLSLCTLNLWLLNLSPSECLTIWRVYLYPLPGTQRPLAQGVQRGVTQLCSAFLSRQQGRLLSSDYFDLLSSDYFEQEQEYDVTLCK